MMVNTGYQTRRPRLAGSKASPGRKPWSRQRLNVSRVIQRGMQGFSGSRLRVTGVERQWTWTGSWCEVVSSMRHAWKSKAWQETQNHMRSGHALEKLAIMLTGLITRPSKLKCSRWGERGSAIVATPWWLQGCSPQTGRSCGPRTRWDRSFCLYRWVLKYLNGKETWSEKD